MCAQALPLVLLSCTLVSYALGALHKSIHIFNMSTAEPPFSITLCVLNNGEITQMMPHTLCAWQWRDWEIPYRWCHSNKYGRCYYIIIIYYSLLHEHVCFIYTMIEVKSSTHTHAAQKPVFWDDYSVTAARLSCADSLELGRHGILLMSGKQKFIFTAALFHHVLTYTHYVRKCFILWVVFSPLLALNDQHFIPASNLPLMAVASSQSENSLYLKWLRIEHRQHHSSYTTFQLSSLEVTKL